MHRDALSAYLNSVAEKYFMVLPGFSGTFFTKGPVAAFNIPCFSLILSDGE